MRKQRINKNRVVEFLQPYSTKQAGETTSCTAVLAASLVARGIAVYSGQGLETASVEAPEMEDDFASVEAPEMEDDFASVEAPEMEDDLIGPIVEEKPKEVLTKKKNKRTK